MKHKLTFNRIASHEAGHLIFMWLFDRPVKGAVVCKGGGVVSTWDNKAEKECAYQHVLLALAGMIAEKDEAAYSELEQHIGQPKHFPEESDSYHVAMAINQTFGGDLKIVHRKFRMVTWRILQKFRPAYNEARKALIANNILCFDVLYEMFGRWDEKFGFIDRPHSDYVVRAVASIYGGHYKRKSYYDWDFTELPADWRKPSRPTLREYAIAMAGRSGLQNGDKVKPD